MAKALESHFNVGSQATIFTERWAKTIFDTRVALGKVSIPLHGKLDAIVDKGSELDVFDYKTREGMSVNEIKGETKNSNGDYFRQLVFYRILLADEPHWRGKKITPALVFISPDKKGRCPIIALPINPEDIDKVKQQISRASSIASGAGSLSQRNATILIASGARWPESLFQHKNLLATKSHLG